MVQRASEPHGPAWGELLSRERVHLFWPALAGGAVERRWRPLRLHWLVDRERLGIVASVPRTSLQGW